MTSFLKLPRNVWILALAQSIGMCATTMMVLVGGLLATRIAPSPKLATVPLASLVIGTATAAVPAALLLRRFGRKRGSLFGYALGISGAGAGFLGTLTSGFYLLALAGLLLGMAAAFWQQFRFAALESVADQTQHGPALSLMLCGGLLAAFVGPEIGARGDELFPALPSYAGSFLLLGLVTLGGLGAFQFYQETGGPARKEEVATRPLREIVKTVAFIIPALGAAIGFGMMTFIMHATPITMHEVCGFDLGSTKRVIQGHIVAMYLPSLFSGALIARFGVGRVMTAGALLYIGVVTIGPRTRALLGQPCPPRHRVELPIHGRHGTLAQKLRARRTLQGASRQRFYGFRCTGRRLALLGLVCAPWLLKEPRYLSRWVAAGVAFVGVLIVVRPDAGLHPLGTVFGLLTACCMAAQHITTRGVAMDNPLTTLIWSGALGSLGLSLLMPFALPAALPILAALSPWQWTVMISTGVSGALGHLLQIGAYRNAPASLLAPFGYLQIVSATATGWLIWGDFPSATSWLGIAIVCGSGVSIGLVEWRRRQSN